jgi:hypothetical protein
MMGVPIPSQFCGAVVLFVNLARHAATFALTTSAFERRIFRFL